MPIIHIHPLCRTMVSKHKTYFFFNSFTFVRRIAQISINLRIYTGGILFFENHEKVSFGPGKDWKLLYLSYFEAPQNYVSARFLSPILYLDFPYVFPQFCFNFRRLDVSIPPQHISTSFSRATKLKMRIHVFVIFFLFTLSYLTQRTLPLVVFAEKSITPKFTCLCSRVLLESERFCES